MDTAHNIINPCSYTKQSLCISTWNVLSLVSSSSKLYDLSKNVDKYHLDLLGITETHMPGSGTEVLDNGSLLVYSGCSDNTHRQGVGILLSKRVKNMLISYTQVYLTV